MHYSLLRFLLITYFFSINLPFGLSADDSVEYGNCSQPISCGSVKSNISYPFWGENRAEYCGKSGYEVTCQANAPMITMRNITFRILDMSNSTVKVARQDYWGTICPSTYEPTNLDLSLFTYSSGLLNVSFWYGCNATVTVTGNSHVCNSSVTATYLTQTRASNVADDPVTTGACQYKVLVPVFESATEALDNNATDIETAIDGGFELDVLNADTGLCNDCLLSGGVCGQSTTGANEFMCFCQTTSSTTTCTENSSPTPNSAPSSSIVFGGFATILMCTCIICIYRKRIFFLINKIYSGVLFKKEERNELDIEEFIRTYGLIAPRRYSYSDVLKMTNSFEHQIGKGGYGTVYKGKLLDGLLVAVKILNESNGDGEEFINEVASIGRTSHVNVVTLSGFCYQRNKRALIYEYMPNGSLDKFTHNQGSFKANCHLEWKTLSEIAVGVARGLEYLHRGCNTRILHFDIKPQNILLDKDFCPKISDFGLAKLCKTKESIVSMLGTRGTAGYIAPEVFSRNFGGVSHKSDVYSYGMLVLEMVGARRNLHSEVSHTSEMFPHYVYKDLELSNDESIFRAIPDEENELVRKMILISLGCIQTMPSDRPSMSKVVEMLEGPLHSLTVPPKPFLIRPTGSVTNEQSSRDAEESMITSQESETC
ncbi:LEAF RUST 10 DISEASE-RESISTANCE LOCUS RECEPTOR-LIKE PROTEIN KINASE-like 2.4 [Rosa sericea]